MADPLDLTAYLLQNPLYQYGGQIRQQGSQTTPVLSPMEGLARALQGGVGGFFQGQAMRDAQSERTEDQETLQKAMQLYATDPKAAQNLLASRPNLSGYGAQIMMSDVNLQKQLELEKEKAKIAAGVGTDLATSLGLGGGSQPNPGAAPAIPSGGVPATPPSTTVPSIQPDLQKSLDGLSAEFKSLTGRDLPITSGARSAADQSRLFANRGTNPYPVAPPGTSTHEKGGAIDVDPATADFLDKSGLLKKYGLHRPYPNDPVHIEPIPNAQPGATPTPIPNAQPGQVQPAPVSGNMPLPQGFTMFNGHPADQAMLATADRLLRGGQIKEGREALIKALEAGSNWSTEVAKGLPSTKVRDASGNETFVPNSRLAGMTNYDEPGSDAAINSALQRGAHDPDFAKTQEYRAAYNAYYQKNTKLAQGGQKLPPNMDAFPVPSSGVPKQQVEELPSAQLDKEMKLGKAFNEIPEVQKFKVIEPMLRAAEDSMTRPGKAADQAILQAYARILVPGSERMTPGKEIEELGKVGSLPEEIKKAINGYVNGGGMSQDERERIMTEARSRYQVFKQAHDRYAKVYGDWAKDVGANPDRVIGLPYEPPAAAAQPEGGAPTHRLTPDGKVEALQ